MSQGKVKQLGLEKLMGELGENLKKHSLNSNDLAEILVKVKVHGRDPRNAEPIFSKSGISTLGEYSFGRYPATVCREASRCIANALLLAPAMRQIYVDLGFALKAADKMKNQDAEDEFLMSRTLFLLTYETKIDLDSLLSTYSLVTNITNHLIRHASELSNKKHRPTPIEAMALLEILKLHFNLSHALPDQNFSSSIEPLFEILGEVELLDQPLQPPVSSAINALANLDFSKPNEEDTLRNADSPRSDASMKVDRLIMILDKAVVSYKPAELENLAIPLFTVLRKVYNAEPEPLKRYMQQQLLPSRENRDLPIGESDDLPSRLLRLTISSGLLNLSECISGLMYELSDKDANLYVRNVGYGYAAGYLVSHHIPVPESAKTSAAGRKEGESQAAVNPVTGQRLDKEISENGPAMTDEEKEREAERLFVLFERLRATGVVDVENPVRRAVEEGQFNQRVEELSDSN